MHLQRIRFDVVSGCRFYGVDVLCHCTGSGAAAVCPLRFNRSPASLAGV